MRPHRRKAPPLRVNRHCATFVTRNGVAVALAGLAALPGAAHAQAEAAATSPVSCVASYYHVYIHNDSQAVIEAGSTIAWDVPFTRSDGRHMLRSPLKPGGRVFLANALGSDYFTGEGACQASLLRVSEAD